MGMSEADTRANLIDPVLRDKGWTQEYVKREETARAVEIVNGVARKRPKGRVDYTLRVKVNAESQPVAVALIEAKAEDLPPTHGLEQAKAYTKCLRFNVPFVFSSNGHRFVMYDRYTGLTSTPRPMSEFPTQDVLRARYEEKIGFRLDDPVARPLLVPYFGGEGGRRYYQDAAIRAVLEKIARCEKEGQPKRALLSLATGAGKTFIAVHLLKRISDAGKMTRALFVCDREELRNQAATHFQNVFGADAAMVSSGDPAKNARVLIATYQTLDVDTDDADANFLVKNYPPDYFSHIFIDEAHRSAWGKWSIVLTRNPSAVQVGMTATPRQIKIKALTPEAEADLKITSDNIKYFGEPVYEYDLAQGIEDGYLAACQIQRSTVNLDDTGITIDDMLALNPVDARTGERITRERLEQEYKAARYDKTDYEDILQLPDRVLAMCRDLFEHLLKTGGPEQKTIIFCVRDFHADQVAIALNNLYAEWCAKNGKPRAEDYAFKCMASNEGNDLLPDLRGSSRTHFIAVTKELLTTGVDVPCVQNIVFFRYVRSPIAFYQMVGRGTRLAEGKLMFRVYDYTDATRLFGEEFITRPASPRVTPPIDGEGGDGEGPLIVSVEGFEVEVKESGRFVVTMAEGGKAARVPLEEYKKQLAARLAAEAPTLADFMAAWIAPDRRRALIDHLVLAGYSPALVRAVEGMMDYDLFDVLGKLTYGLAPYTRRQRADVFDDRQAAWLASLPPDTAATVLAMAAQFAQTGIEGLESSELFRTPKIRKAGGLDALKKVGEPANVVHEAKARLFAA